MYQLNVNNNAFADRTKAIFDQLVVTSNNKIEIDFEDDDIENENSIELANKSVNKSITQSNSIPLNLSNLRLNEEDDKLFVKPTISVSDFKKQPDYVKNPHKWKKYTLEDVQESQMSASANLQAAFSFLNRNEPKFDQQEILYNKPIGGKKYNLKEIELKLLENLNEETEEENANNNNNNKMIIAEKESSKSESMFRKSKKHAERNIKLKSLDEVNEEEENDEMEIKNSQHQDDVIMTSETNNDIDDFDSSNDNYDYVDGVDCNDYLI
jgi:hypothetical protein